MEKMMNEQWITWWTNDEHINEWAVNKLMKDEWMMSKSSTLKEKTTQKPRIWEIWREVKKQIIKRG